MEIISEIMKDPARRARLHELVGRAVAAKHRIVEHREHLKNLRRDAAHDIRLDPRDFNAEVKRYWKK